MLSAPQTEDRKIQFGNQLKITGNGKAYFASGCFWCVEYIYESLAELKRLSQDMQVERPKTQITIRLHRRNRSRRDC